jgi:hypothetical protein
MEIFYRKLSTVHFINNFVASLLLFYFGAEATFLGTDISFETEDCFVRQSPLLATTVVRLRSRKLRREIELYIFQIISRSPQGNKRTEKNEILRGFPQSSLQSPRQKLDESKSQFATEFSIQIFVYKKIIYKPSAHPN